MMSGRRKIQILPEHLINQIKAGEVIDRPSSLIKEILENALDAESTQIQFHIVDNGLGLISLEDNGKGMMMEELPYAFARHATSKLEKFDDLYQLSSFGFRGEALASIASIARVQCSSLPREDLSKGGKILIEGGEQKNLLPFSGSQSGTALYIKDLFYNTPARLKFIKSKVSEKNAIKKTLSSFLLAHPQVGFQIRFDDKEKKNYLPSPLEERVRHLMVKKGAEENLVSFVENYEGYELKGFILPQEDSLLTSNYLFINQRYFVDKGIHQVLSHHLAELTPGKGFAYVLFFKAPADEIDVNVHPGKIEIKFLKAGTLFSLLHATLRKHFKKETRPREEERKTLPGKASLPQKESEGPAPSLSTPLSPCFQLLEHENQKYLFHTWKYALIFFKDEIVAHAPLKEEELMPLLVSEPYPSRDECPLAQFKAWGLELDQLSGQTLILRTIPSKLRVLPYRIFVGELLKLWTREGLEALFEKLPERDFFIHDSFLQAVFEEKERWEKNKVLIPLNEKNLGAFFK